MSKSRLLESFGVSGLLGEECTVFYSSLFSLRHAGRVSDLMIARLTALGADELSLRAVLLYTLYDVYRAQQKGAVEPMVIECGHDAERVAIGAAFTYGPTEDVKKFTDPSLRSRVIQGVGANEFENLLVGMARHCHRLVVRVQPSIRRVEIVSVIPLDAAASAGLLVDLVVIAQNPKASPKVGEYVEIGDLDYPQLLREDSPADQVPAPRTGELLVASVTQRVGKSKEDHSLAESLRKIRGTTDHIRDDRTLVKGSVNELDNAVIRINAGPISEEADDSAQVRLLKEQIAELQRKLFASGKEKVKGGLRLVEAPAAESEDGAEEDADEAEAKPKGIFKKIWPFKRVEAVEESEDDVSEDDEPAPEAPVFPGVVPGETPLPPLAEAAAIPGNADAAVKSLMVEIQSGSMDRALTKAQREAPDFKKERGTTRVKKWVDTLLAELVLEKGRLLEMAKKLNASVKLKDVEFRNREHTLQEELRRRDDMIRQKNSALARAKEQVAQVSLSLGRAKSAAHSGSGDDSHFKVKFQQTQKLLGVFKEENETLRDKVEELKNALSSAQFAAAAKKGPSAQDYALLVARAEKLQRLAEEFKRQNGLLMDRVADKEKREKTGAAGSHEETRKRLEAAMKLITVTKKDYDRLSLKLEEQEREKDRLQRELVMTQAEIRALKLSRGGGGQQSGGKPPAAA